VTFNNSGGLVVPGVNIASVALDVDPVLLPAAQSQDLVVTVSTLGTIRMCDPNVVSPNPRACN
jgi:hypothetical protein